VRNTSHIHLNYLNKLPLPFHNSLNRQIKFTFELYIPLKHTAEMYSKASTEKKVYYI